MTAWAWASGSRRLFGLPVEFGSDGYGWTSWAIQIRHSPFEPFRAACIGRNHLHRVAELCARAVIGGQVRPDQRGKEPDRGIAPGTLAQPLEHADVRFQQPPPRFFLAAPT